MWVRCHSTHSSVVKRPSPSKLIFAGVDACAANRFGARCFRALAVTTWRGDLVAVAVVGDDRVVGAGITGTKGFEARSSSHSSPAPAPAETPQGRRDQLTYIVDGGLTSNNKARAGLAADDPFGCDGPEKTAAAGPNLDRCEHFRAVAVTEIALASGTAESVGFIAQFIHRLNRSIESSDSDTTLMNGGDGTGRQPA